jgi:hypothetical protein
VRTASWTAVRAVRLPVGVVRAVRSGPRRLAVCRAALAGAIVLLGGCASLMASGTPASGTHPASPTSRTTSPAPTGGTPVDVAQRTHEYLSPPPPAQSAAGGAPSAVAAVTAFASAYINWTARTVAGDLRSLAAGSVGQARSAMELAAAQTAADYQLQRGGIANSGQVEAVAPLRGRPNRYVVVTLERTTATATTAYQGLAPAWHIAIASVVQLAPGRWVVSGWQPES